MGAHLHAVADGADHVGARTQVGLAALGVDDHRVALVDPVAQAGQAADAGDVERSGDDGGVAGRGALLQQQPAQLGAVVFQQVGGAEVAGDEDGVLGQDPLAAALAAQVTQQAVVEVFQVVQALTQVGIAGLADAGAVFGAHPLHRRLGGETRAHRLLQIVVPAAGMGQHLIGLEHVVGRAENPLVAVEHGVDLVAQVEDGGGELGLLRGRIVRQQLADRHRRLVQHRHAVGQAVGELGALHPLGAVRGDLDVLERLLAELTAGGDHFREHHGDDLEVLDLFLAIDAAGAVLDHQHADSAAAAQQGDAQEGVERIFAGLRTVGEGRVAGGVGEVQRPADAHDLADQALARLQARDVDGAGVETFGGEQFQLARTAAQIDRADLGDHRIGDGAHDHVELGLSRTGPGHGFANLLEQTARPPCGESRCRHGGLDALPSSLALHMGPPLSLGRL